MCLADCDEVGTLPPPRPSPCWDLPFPLLKGPWRCARLFADPTAMLLSAALGLLSVLHYPALVVGWWQLSAASLRVLLGSDRAADLYNRAVAWVAQAFQVSCWIKKTHGGRDKTKCSLLMYGSTFYISTISDIINDLQQGYGFPKIMRGA